jgi:hypothetical protein
MRRYRFLLLLAVWTLPLFAKGGRTLDAMEPTARETALAAMKWNDAYWDDRAAFLWNTGEAPAASRSGGAPRSRRHLVRETSWYALGLLMRGGDGDRDKAIRAFEAVLDNQIDDPSQPFHGTFQRSPEEPRPPQRYARLFVEYDPNWREFIGTTLLMILEEYADQLPAPLRRRMEASIVKAVEGERKEGRLKPTYTNISLMYGVLWTWAGKHLNHPTWVAQGEQWCTETYQLFKKNNTFEEYNSPTYYGVDFYGLALWRVYGVTPAVRKMGSDMEAELWKDVGAYYHAGLKNVAGPYDRSYGMDMQKYVSLTGLWLRTVLDPKLAPFPEIAPGPLDHSNDLIYAPLFAVLGAKIPAEAMKNFEGFGDERQVRRVITPQRVATAWIGRDFIAGAESTNLTREAGAQFHPATVHWKTPAGEAGWIRLYQGPRLNAQVEKETLTISGVGDYTFRMNAPALESKMFQRELWLLPGLSVKLDTDARGMTVTPGNGFMDVQYREATKFTLHLAGGWK